MSGRMPFIDILLPYPHSGTDTKYRLLNLFLFVLQICGYLRFGTICDVKPVCTPRTDLSCAACILTSQSRVQESNLFALHLPRHKKKHPERCLNQSRFLLSQYFEWIHGNKMLFFCKSHRISIIIPIYWLNIIIIIFVYHKFIISFSRKIEITNLKSR